MRIHKRGGGSNQVSFTCVPVSVYTCASLAIASTTHTAHRLVPSRLRMSTRMQVDRSLACVRADATRPARCAATSGQPVHRLPPSPARPPLRDCEHRGARHWTTRLARWQAPSCQYEKNSAKKLCYKIRDRRIYMLSLFYKLFIFIVLLRWKPYFYLLVNDS